MKTTKLSVRTITVVGLLAAMGIILSYFEIPIVPGNDYLKFDPSEIPVLLAVSVGGMVPALLVALVKNLIQLLSTTTLGIGQLINFSVSAVFALSFYLVQKKVHLRASLKMVLTFIVCTIAVVVAGLALNFVLTPVYNAVKGYPNDWAIIWLRLGQATVLNVIKPILTLVVTLPITFALQKASGKMIKRGA